MLLAFVSAIGALVTMIYCDEMEKIADVETHENDVGSSQGTHSMQRKVEARRKSYKQKSCQQKSRKKTQKEK